MNSRFPLRTWFMLDDGGVVLLKDIRVFVL